MVDYLDNIHSYSRFVVPTELSEDLYVADINTAYASIAGTKKHTALTSLMESMLSLHLKC